MLLSESGYPGFKDLQDGFFGSSVFVMPNMSLFTPKPL
jgi:hypothetical protein